MAAVRRAISQLIPRHSVYLTSIRSISTTYTLHDNDEKLKTAKEKVMQLTEDPGNTAKLQLYALYKQVCLCVCV